MFTFIPTYAPRSTNNIFSTVPPPENYIPNVQTGKRPREEEEEEDGRSHKRPQVLEELVVNKTKHASSPKWSEYIFY